MRPGVILSISLLLCFIPVRFVSSQDYSIVFSHADVNNGLSDNWVKSIYRDSKGFIWFGTNSGLNRFDGYDFEVFSHSAADSLSIADNVINAITEDSEGNLWVGTRSGISVLDGDSYTFSGVNLVPSMPLACQDIAYITAMVTGESGDLLIGTHNGLFLFNHISKSFRHLLPDEQSCSSELNNITAIAPDKDGSYWIGTSNCFIFRFLPQTNSFEKFECRKGMNENSG
ncbi:MAG TPA: hypothetical protein DCY25_01885, partial [Bacteroidales bacterium]|nr:hypothetical protein [Bacteroidales bacterium]